MNKYLEMKKRHQAEINAFPMFWAFSKAQFADGMQKLGLTENDKDKVCHIPSGGFLKKEDMPKLTELIDRHARERDEAIKADRSGNGFIYQMFYYELNNHEYSYTEDYEDTLDALGITYDDLEEHPNLKHGLEKAAEKIRNAEVF